MNSQPPNHPQAQPLGRIQLLAAMGVTALVLLLIARFWLLFDSVAALPLIWRLDHLFLGLGLGASIVVTSAAVYQLWPAYRQSAQFYLEFVLRPLMIADVIWMGLLPGLSEELLFRGVMLPALGLNLNGIVFSSLCFGVLHLSSLQQWPYVIWATVVGVSLGWGTVETGNLLVPIVAHVFANWVSALLWKLRQA